LKSTYGHEFFNEISLQLNNAIGADYTFIAQVNAEKNTATTLSLIAKGKLVDNFEYELINSPCNIVVTDSVCVYPKDICQYFPQDQLLRDMNIEGYIGIALCDSNNQTNGIIVALYESEVTNADFVRTLLELFTGRVSAEIERYKQKSDLERLNKALKSKNTALRKSEAKLTLHLQNTPLGCITWDDQFRCTEWNKAAENIFGYTAEEAIGNYAANLIIPHEIKAEINDVYQLLLEQKGGFQNSNNNIRKSGETIKCDWYNSPVVTDDGSVTGIFSLIHDITEKDQQEELLRRSQKMDALGKLTGGIAHDQNNILGIILGYSELLSMKLKDQPKLFDYSKKIQHASQRGAQLISKLLSLSRTNTLTSSESNLNKILLEQKETLEKTLTAQIKLTLELCSDGWPIWVDKHDLEDAIFNLSINAMHAMKKRESGRELVIQSKNISLSLHDTQNIGVKAGDYVQLCITDNGCGIEEKLIEKIFDPFVSTKGEEGTGLGLSQVFSFVNRSKGSITVKSQLDHGTSFTLLFPRYNNSSIKKRKTEKTNKTSYHGDETILIVDDEFEISSLCANLLTLQGYSTFCADGYKQAMEILDKEKIDLMISDVIMPEMNGYQLSAIVEKMYPSVKIQLASGFSEVKGMGDINKSLQQNLINKPYSSEALYRKVRNLLDS